MLGAARCVSRNHLSGPRTPLRTVDGDHVTLAEHSKELHQNLTKLSVQRLEINHRSRRRKSDLREDGMPELQETPKNTLICSPEVGHLSTVGRIAQDNDESHDQRFTKVVTRVVSTRIGNGLEGGEEDVQVRNGL